ncbi:MAG: hypothetical protein M1833_001107 [Piccolia ochrophora]|nr:MAG: hypothetical protein M1833_001107 [Piccolia ochrophora]
MLLHFTPSRVDNKMSHLFPRHRMPPSRNEGESTDSSRGTQHDPQRSLEPEQLRPGPQSDRTARNLPAPLTPPASAWSPERRRRPSVELSMGLQASNVHPADSGRGSLQLLNRPDDLPRPTSSPDDQGHEVVGRRDERLPSLSQLLTSEPKAPPKPHSQYSPRWSIASSVADPSPQHSPMPGLRSVEPSSGQSSLFPDRPTPRSSSFAMPTLSELPSVHSFTSAPSQAIKLPMHYSPPISDRAHRDSPFWSPRSEQAVEQHHQRSFRALSAGHTPPGIYQAPRMREPVQSAEAIGPSIWTGTHFLPRFVGERNVPGEGLCYFYDDGTHCKTVIDGEAVNAHWGVTKAGKPRKRLAVACLTCREKKIKCDPDFPKCIQCEKFGRTCKFKNAPRGHRPSPESFSYEFSDSPAFSTPANPGHDRERLYNVPQLLKSPPYEAGMYLARKRRSSSAFSRRSNENSDIGPLENLSAAEHSLKRRRASSPRAPRYALPLTEELTEGESRARAPTSNEIFGSTILRPSTAFAWQRDPREVSPELVQHLLELYFIKINPLVGEMLPRSFLRWVEQTREKSPDDLMLLYAMLTIASNFSNRPDRKSFSKDFLRIARHAVDSRCSDYTIQLIQSRLLLSIHYFSSNQATEAWDFSGAAMRAASGLGLMFEATSMTTKDRNEELYGLNEHAFAECKRRTFWAVRLADVIMYDNGLGYGHGLGVDNEDIFLRLPCSDNAYEDHTEEPLFGDWLEAHRLSPLTRLSVGAYFVQIATIWTKVLTHNQRHAHRSICARPEVDRTFYATTSAHLAQWVSSLPAHLTNSLSNLDSATENGTLDTFVTLHALYHATQMTLHRRGNVAQLSQETARSNIRTANQHARALFEMLRAAANRRERVQKDHGDLATPFVGHALMLACDILSARGRLADLAATLPLLEDGSRLLLELRPYWASARAQRARLQDKIEELKSFLSNPEPLGKLFESKTPALATAAAKEYDLIHGTPLELFADALGDPEMA